MTGVNQRMGKGEVRSGDISGFKRLELNFLLVNKDVIYIVSRNN